jgi:hypothetical protein
MNLIRYNLYIVTNNNNNMRFFTKKTITKSLLTLTLFSFAIFTSPFISKAAVLLTDDFTGTTIDTVKWNETDASGIGGTVGNIQQNGALSLGGSTAWGTNYVVTDTTYDRFPGSLEMEADITCGASNSIFGIGYGDPGVLTGGGQSYTMYVVSNQIYFSRQLSNGNAENTPTGINCTNGVPFHARIVINPTTGARLFINGSGTPAATMTGGTFTNKGFFLSGHSGTATLVDNFSVSSDTITVPNAPTGLAATPSNAQVALSWVAPVDNGGTPITDYIVEYKLATEPTTWTTFSDGVSTTTSTIVTGLVNLSNYNFRVSTVNAIGTGAPSTVVSATPTFSVSSAPQSLSASNALSGRSYLSWSAPLTNGGTPITDYIVEYKLATEPTTWTTFSDGVSTTTSAMVTGLTNGLSYNFRVSAVNSIGTSAPSNIANGKPNSTLMSDDFSGTTIDIDKWVEIDMNGLGGTVGNVQQNGSLTTLGNNSWGTNLLRTVDTYVRDGDVTASVDVIIANCAGTDTMSLSYGGHLISNSTYFAYYNEGTIKFRGFSPAEEVVISPAWSCTNNVPFNLKMTVLEAGGAQMYVDDVLKATINSGTYTGTFALQGFINTATFDNFGIAGASVGPEAPTSLNATSGNAQVPLSWVASVQNGTPVTDYLVQYKLSTASTWTMFSDGVSTTTSTIVTGLTNGLSYDFRVSGVDINGTGDPSNLASAMPISPIPTAPTASTVGISGGTSVGEVLTGTYVYLDANGNTESGSTYRWLSSDTAGGVYSPISGANSLTYTVQLADITKYLKFEVTPNTSVAPTTGTPVQSSASTQVSEINYLNQVLSTGQSLSVGVAAGPALSTTQPYANKMLSGGSGGIGSGTSFIPLVESGVETMSSSLANSLTFNDLGNDLDTVVSLHGVSGYTYSQLKKGTAPYSTAMTQVTNAKNAATALGRVSKVIGVTSIHGETDNFNGVSGATYQGYLEEWQNDYDTDVKAITGQTSEVPLFIDQMSSFMSSYANDPTSEIPIYQLYAAEANPGEIVLVAPKYFFNYSDRHHLTNASSRWLGEYHAKVIKKVSLENGSWRPLSPDSATRSGNIIDVNFHVPAGVLAFDTTLVSPRTNYGFEYYDTTNSATISSVQILDTDTVRVTLSGIPTGSNQRIRYAYRGVPGTNTGSQNAGSAAGNLRDTDPATSLYGNTLYNWAVHFDEAITLDTTAPPTPTTPDLATASDTGVNTTDNQTNDTTPSFNITCTEPGTITLYEEGTPVASYTCTGTETATITAPAVPSDGSYDYTTTASDLAGNISGSSPTLTVTIDTSITATTINTPTTGTPVSGNAEPGSTVTVTTPSGSSCTTTTSITGSYSCNLTPLPTDGENITATATDTYGNISSVTQTGGIDTDAPITPTINPVTAGSTTITGTGENGTTITVTGITCTNAPVIISAGVWSCTILATDAPEKGDTITVVSTDSAGNTAQGSYVIPNPTSPTSSSSSSSITYVCKDSKATNYKSFGRHKPSLCKYSTATSVTTPTTDNPFGGEQCPSNQMITNNMKQGDRDGRYGSYQKGIVTQVHLLQEHMNRLLKSEYNQAAGPVDGIYGALTKQGVQRLQAKLNQLLPTMKPLVTDGIVGAYTKRALNVSC